MAPKPTPRTPRTPLSKLKKKADELYSRVLRQEAADANGMVACYTCSTVDHWKNMHCGHFVTRTITVLRYNPMNTRPQCPGCNLFNQGRLDVFAAKLVREYGPGVLEELQAAKQIKLSPAQTRALYEGVIASCTEKLATPRLTPLSAKRESLLGDPLDPSQDADLPF